MFLTNRKSEFFGGLLRGSNGDQLWSLVEQNLLLPWFYLQIVRAHGRASYRSMMLISSVQELEDFLATTGKRLWIEEALIVTPAAVNLTGHWLMEPLLEVAEVLDRHGEMAGYSFRVESGQRYVTATSEPPESCFPSATVFDAQVHILRAS